MMRLENGQKRQGRENVFRAVLKPGRKKGEKKRGKIKGRKSLATNRII